MKSKNKVNYILVGTIVALVVILGILFIIQQSPQEIVTCNAPYIKVGTSCCLDENYNNICDKDEKLIQREDLLLCEESLKQCEIEINSTCYKNKMISQLQAENIAKHFALIQVKLVNPYIALSDIGVWTSSTIGKKCNPDWLVILRFNDTQNDEGYNWWIRVNGQIENTTPQGIKDLPDDYVLSKVDAYYEYHTSTSRFPYVGSSSGYSGV